MKQKRTIMMVILNTVFAICGFAQSQTQIPVEKIAKLFAQGYSYDGDFHEGMAKIQHNKKYGYINKDGDLVVPCIYDALYDYSNGVAVAGIIRLYDWEKQIFIESEKDNKRGSLQSSKEPSRDVFWGLIDKNGKEIIPFIYNNELKFHNNLALAYKFDRKKGIIDIKGNVIIPFGKYDYISAGKELYYAIKKDKEGWGLLDKDAKIIFPVPTTKDKLLFHYYYDNEMICARIDNTRWKIAIKGGSQILPDIFDEKKWHSDEIVEVRKGNEYYYLTSLGVKLPKSKYSNYIFREYKNGFFIVKSDKGCSLMDSNGKITSAFYKSIKGISDDGFAVVENESNKSGIIDLKGNIIIPCKYRDIEGVLCNNKKYIYHPINNFVIVKERIDNKNVNAILDRQGKIVFPFGEIKYKFKENGDIQFNNENGTGLMTKDGKELLPAIYDEIGERCDGLIPVKKDGVWGYADENGHSTFDYKFENVQNEEKEAKPAQEENKPQVKEKKKKSKFMNFLNKVMEDGKKQ